MRSLINNVSLNHSHPLTVRKWINILLFDCHSFAEHLFLNMAKQKLSDSEKAILRELIFPESFEHIQAETGFTFGTIRDDLIKLINHGFIEVYEDDLTTSVSPFYDSDNIDQFSFKATNRGLKIIQNYAFRK